MRRVLACLGLILIAGRLCAHIGSPAAVLEGKAGPYSLRVIVLPAPVVPGQAEIDVRLLDADPGAVEVTVLPVHWFTGLKGAPPPDATAPVPGEPDLRHGQLWIMSPGSYSVHVTASGSRGSGTLIVPIDAVATARLPMAPVLGVLLAILGAGLVIGLVAIAAAGVRESTLLPDAVPSSRQRRSGWIAAGIAALVIALLLAGGRRWWNQEDSNFRSNQIYRANPLDASIDGGVLNLTVARDGTYFSGNRLPLIPDHGKLMHLFAIREPDLDAMAHLHPVRADGRRSFAVQMPALPAGRYRLYADITYDTGFAATLTTTVDWNPAAVVATSSEELPPARDPDDSWWIGTPGPARGAVRLVRAGPTQVRAGTDLSLGFAIENAAGQPVAGEPYMGMLGHAAVRRLDGSVFAHIHPVGTVSMASEQYFEAQAAGQTGAPLPAEHHQHHAAGGSHLAFPYLFPQPGKYRIWVQAKVDGKVVTDAFDYDVTS